MNASDALADLARLLAPDAVSTDIDDLMAHARDWSPRALLDARSGVTPDLPLCVARPTSTPEVARLLEWAQSTRTPVVPFGGGSDVVQGIVPTDAVVVDLAEMWRIRDLDTKSMIVYVEAGVTGPQLREALAVEGLITGHEPQSHDISTVGGWVATKACGQLSSGYGGIEDLIVGIEAVLPGGKIVRSKVTPRRSAGPDVASLMIGSEGTLGIVTAAALRVSRSPEERVSRCLRFAHMTDGVKAARTIAQDALHPTMLRLYDSEDAMLFLRNHPDEPQGPLMLMSFAGHHAQERAERAVGIAGGDPGSEALVEHWWAHRNDAVGEFRKIMRGEGLLGPHAAVDTIEVSGTWTVLRQLYHSIKEGLKAEADLVACHISHIYVEGACLYFTMGSMTDSDDEARVRFDTWWNIAMQECIAAGGSISHHHGIGRTKAPWLKDELGGWWDVLRMVKGAIDPHRIMNPGVLGL